MNAHSSIFVFHTPRCEKASAPFSTPPLHPPLPPVPLEPSPARLLLEPTNGSSILLLALCGGLELQAAAVRCVHQMPPSSEQRKLHSAKYQTRSRAPRLRERSSVCAIKSAAYAAGKIKRQAHAIKSTATAGKIKRGGYVDTPRESKAGTSKVCAARPLVTGVHTSDVPASAAALSSATLAHRRSG